VDGNLDHTTTLVRQGIEPSSSPLTLKQVMEETTNWQTDKSAMPPSKPQLESVTSRLHGRIHSRTILATYGWSILRFSSPLEVVQTLRSALRGRMGFLLDLLEARSSRTTLLRTPSSISAPGSPPGYKHWEHLDYPGRYWGTDRLGLWYRFRLACASDE
jgi:hypothetical protein